MTNINLQLWTNQWRKLSVALKGITRHIDMEPAFPSPTNHLKCRLSILFSFPVNSIQLCNYVWTSKNPVCSLALLFLKLCVLEKNYVFLLPIGERFYLLRHFFCFVTSRSRYTSRFSLLFRQRSVWWEHWGHLPFICLHHNNWWFLEITHSNSRICL